MFFYFIYNLAKLSNDVVHARIFRSFKIRFLDCLIITARSLSKSFEKKSCIFFIVPVTTALIRAGVAAVQRPLAHYERQISRLLIPRSLFMYWRRSVTTLLVARARLAASKSIVAKSNGSSFLYLRLTCNSRRWVWEKVATWHPIWSRPPRATKGWCQGECLGGERVWSLYSNFLLSPEDGGLWIRRPTSEDISLVYSNFLIPRPKESKIAWIEVTRPGLRSVSFPTR